MATDNYNHTKVETKWQKKWAEEDIYKTPDTKGKKNRYVLDMFPYPSGSSMHVGHLEGYVGTDILSRYFRMKGDSVLHPMGWDAFGLPAENYAIKTGIHPDKSTHDNIKTFKRQLEISGMSYDWSREIDTSSPEFYKWTQWLFIQLFKAGLAYKKKSPVNFCPKDETVLANEQVIDGRCERCDTPVIQKELDQWFFKITVYADRLISGLSGIDWEDEVKRQQINWIGKSEGISFKERVKDLDIEIEVFDSVPQTFVAQTFTVIAPEHPLVEKLVKGTKYEKEVMAFVNKIKEKKSANKFDIDKEVEGVFTGRYVENPFGKGDLPIWIASYAIYGYGSGIVNCSAHDERDFAFAKKYGIPLRIAMLPKDKNLAEKVKNFELCYHHAEDGIIQEPQEFKGLTWSEAREPIIDYIKDKGLGEIKAHYHIRDWLISRQRYWGCPIPMIYCEHCASKGVSIQGDTLNAMTGWFPVEEKDLPIMLPTDVDFLPHGESPIARSKTFQKDIVCPNCGKSAKREVDTMDTYVDSSWYFMRFCDPKNDKEFASIDKIVPVDDYVGGGHVVQHLLFARFFWKFLFDQGLIDQKVGDEPFLKLRAPGWILGPDSRKMSKRWGNVITPDDIIPKYGADTLRVYEMFMGPFDVMKPWSVTGVEGAYRFLGKVWRLFDQKFDDKDDPKALTQLHQTIKKVGEDIENYKFNTAISSLMQLVNTFVQYKVHSKEYLEKLVLLVAPFAPHLAEEIWVEILKKDFSVHQQLWPKYDSKYLEVDQMTIVIQINGKVRAQLNIESDIVNQESKVTELAKKDEKVAKWLEGKTIKKTIFVPGKLINFVV